MSTKEVTGYVLGGIALLAVLYLAWYFLDKREKEKLAKAEAEKEERKPTTIIHFAPQYHVQVQTQQVESQRLLPTSYEESLESIRRLKDHIENKDGNKLLYNEDGSVKREKAIHQLFRAFLYGKISDANGEVNNGRGAVDFKLSQGRDKTLIEFKKASNRNLKKNIQNQTGIYSKANDDAQSITVVVITSESEQRRVDKILAELERGNDKNIVLIDARKDRPTASVA